MDTIAFTGDGITRSNACAAGSGTVRVGTAELARQSDDAPARQRERDTR